jgi:uncharacterized membrane-anchored protein
MKTLLTGLCLLLFFAQNTNAATADTATAYTSDSITFQTLNYDTAGTVAIGLGLANFQIPKGFKFLNAKQSAYVLHDLWGNPPAETLGMIFPEDASDILPNTWAIEITYDEDGHVKDDDAKDIKYDELLEQMQKELEEVNPERKKQGYPTVELTGWASPPFYDADAKKLHWAKKLRFEGDSLETLNYNIRILGRKGVLVLNAIGGMDKLFEIKSHIKPVLASVNFVDGNQYSDFNSSTDKVAAYGLVGLIAGGVLAKTGLFAKLGLVLLKFAKVIVLAVGGAFAAIVKWFKGRNDDKVNPNL